MPWKSASLLLGTCCEFCAVGSACRQTLATRTDLCCFLASEASTKNFAPLSSGCGLPSEGFHPPGVVVLGACHGHCCCSGSAPCHGRGRREFWRSASQTPGRIQKVDPPYDSAIYTIRALQSGIGGSTFWILPGVSVESPGGS